MIARVLAFLKKYPFESAFFAAACLLRLTLLPVRSLWFDEGTTMVVTGAPLSQLPGLLRVLEGTPPLYYLLVRLFRLVMGDPLWAMRSVSLLSGIAALLVFARFCRELLPKNWRLAFFMGCFSSYWIHLSIDGRAYSLLLLLGLSEALLLRLLTKKGSAGLLGAYAAVGALGLYVHNYFAFMLLTHFLYGAMVFRSEPRRLGVWLAVHLLAAAAFVPWLPSLNAQIHRPGGYLLKVWLSWEKLGQMAGDMAFDVSFLGLILGHGIRYVGWAVLAAALGGGVWGLSRRPAPEAAETLRFCLFHLAVPCLLVGLMERVLNQPLTESRYFAACSPPLFVLLAWVASEALSGWGGSAARIGVAGLFLASSVGYAASASLIDPHLERMSATILKNSDRRSVVFHLLDYYYLPLRLYYLPELPHFLLCPARATATSTGRNVDWDGLPGFRVAVSKEQLSAMKSCVLIDPERRLSEHVYLRAPCAELAQVACP